jgi:hypothetical protein
MFAFALWRAFVAPCKFLLRGMCDRHCLSLVRALRVRCSSMHLRLRQLVITTRRGAVVELR